MHTDFTLLDVLAYASGCNFLSDLKFTGKFTANFKTLILTVSRYESGMTQCITLRMKRSSLRVMQQPRAF